MAYVGGVIVPVYMAFIRIRTINYIVVSNHGLTVTLWDDKKIDEAGMMQQIRKWRSIGLFGMIR